MVTSPFWVSFFFLQYNIEGLKSNNIIKKMYHSVHMCMVYNKLTTKSLLDC